MGGLFIRRAAARGDHSGSRKSTKTGRSHAFGIICAGGVVHVATGSRVIYVATGPRVVYVATGARVITVATGARVVNVATDSGGRCT